MRRSNLNLEGIRIGFRNFEGRAQKYNQEGNRNFAVFIDSTLAEDLEKQGWNVHWPKTPEGDINPDRDPFIKVRVNFNFKGLKAVMIVNNQPRFLDEETIGALDTADLENVDISINPYEYEPGKISASLSAIYATVRTDEFTSKYGY